jgi:peptide deformylase
MIRDILQIGDPLLNQKTQEVEDITSDLVQNLIQDLIDTSLSVADRSAGLSANQIGQSYSICVVRRVDLEEENEDKNNSRPIPDNRLWLLMINPEISITANDKSYFWEGCLSVGKCEKETIYGPVLRNDEISVSYMNRAGESKTIEAKGFFAHVVQHELDHLNGELFIGKVQNPERNLWKAEEIDEYLKHHKQWPEIT